VDLVYGSAVKGFAVEMDEKSARQLAADPAVASVEQDREVGLADTQTGATWGLDRIDQPGLPLSGTYTYPSTASTVTAYVLDTGVRLSHSQFGGRARSGYDFIDNDAPSPAPRTVSPSKPRSFLCGCSTARAAAPTPRSSRAWTGSPATRFGPRSPT
jgi:subtilisin family serine protease